METIVLVRMITHTGGPLVGSGVVGTMNAMTTREKAHRLLDELPESEVEPVVEFIASRQQGGNVDAWGDLDRFSAALTADTFRRLDERERAAGSAPWERESPK